MIRVSNDWWMNITVFFLWRPSCYSTSRSDLSSSKSTASLTSKTTWYGTVESSRDTAWRPCRWWCWIRMIPRAIKKMMKIPPEWTDFSTNVLSKLWSNWWTQPLFGVVGTAPSSATGISDRDRRLAAWQSRRQLRSNHHHLQLRLKRNGPSICKTRTHWPF